MFSDTESGASSERTGFKEVIELIKQGKVSTLRAVAWDRLIRDPQLGFMLKTLLREHGVQLILLNQGLVDLETSAGDLSSDMQILLGAYERKMIIDRVKDAHEKRRKQEIAWQVFPFGYKNVNKQYVLDTDPCVCPLEERPHNYLELGLDDEPDNSPRLLSWSKVRIAREMIEGFLEWRKGSRVLQRVHARFGSSVKKNRQPIPGLVIPGSISGLKRWLRNPVLRGHTSYQKYPRKGSYPDISEWTIIRDTHLDQALMTEEESQEVEEIISSSFGKRGKPERTYHLTGKITCEECNGRCDFKRGGSYTYYGCGHSRTYCSNRKFVRIEAIEEAIIYQISKRANEIYLEDEISKPSESVRIIEIKKKIKDIEELSWASHDRDLSRLQKDLHRELKTEMNKPQEVAQEIIRHPQSRKINFWYTLTRVERELFYDKLVDNVVIGGGKVVIVNLRV